MRTRSGGEYAALLGRPGYRSFVLTVSLSRITSAMFMTSGVLLVLGRTGSAGLAGSELLDRASAIEATSLNLGIVVGPAVAGALAGAIDAPAVVEIQAGLTLAVAALIAVNPVFEARPATQAGSLRQALSEGTHALVGHRLLRNISSASILANFSWGLMTIAFPLYAAQQLHAGAHASGYLWAAVALGSILGTFGLAGTPSARRVGLSYAALALSALLWPLAGTLLVGFLLITLTGFIEGPASRARSPCVSAISRPRSAARCSTRWGASAWAPPRSARPSAACCSAP